MAHNPYTPPSAELADLAGGSLPPRPWQMKAALGLIFASLAISAIGWLLDGNSLGYEPNAPRALRILLTVVYVVLCGVLALLIAGVALGYRSARIALSAVIGITVVSEVRDLPVAIEGEWGYIALYLLSMVVESTCVVLLFTPAAHAWFRAANLARSKI